MRSQPWTRAQCDNRLRTDLKATCNLLEAEDRPYCTDKVYALYVLSTIRGYPSTDQPFCNRCITPIGNPTEALDLS